MLNYLVQPADPCQIDLIQAVADKLLLNGLKYPPADVAAAADTPPLALGRLGSVPKR